MAIPGKQVSNLPLRFRNPLRPSPHARVIQYGDANVALAPSDLDRSLANLTITAARTVTSPSAANIVAASFRSFVGAGSDFFVRANGAVATFVPGAGVTVVGNTTLGDGRTQHYLLRITSISAGAEAATIYDLGCAGIIPASLPICSAIATFETTSVPSGGTVRLSMTNGSTIGANCFSVDTVGNAIDFSDTILGDYVFTVYIVVERTANYTVAMGSSGGGTLTTQPGTSITANDEQIFVFQGHLAGASAGDELFVNVTDDGAATEDAVIVATPNEFAASSIRVDRV